MRANKYDKLAIELQRAVLAEEHAEGQMFSPAESYQAAVRTRGDAVLVVTYMGFINRQLRTIKYLLAAIATVLVLYGCAAADRF